MKRHHPDATGQADGEMAKKINAARIVLFAWLGLGHDAQRTDSADRGADVDQGDGNTSAPNGPGSSVGAPAGGFAKPKDNRATGGALWSGIVVALGTPLPAGWLRADSRGGAVWTKLPGDADSLLGELLLALPDAVFTRLPAWDDLRSKGGALWSGFTVEADAALPIGWLRATAGGHPGQAYTKALGDAGALVEALWQTLNPGLFVHDDD